MLKATCRTSPTPVFSMQAPLITNNLGRLADTMLHEIIHSVCESDAVYIRQITTPGAYQELCEARLRLYNERSSYFDKLTAPDGTDQHDERSYLFAAYYQDRIIGTVRLTPFPFEVCDYVEPPRLELFLGPGQERNFLEFSRLVIERRCPVNAVARALIIYSGLLTSLLTDFNKYIAVARQQVRRKSFKFNINRSVLPFFIRERGDHEYELMSGCFASEFHQLIRQHAAVLSTALLDHSSRHTKF